MKRAAASLDEVIQRAIELISSDGVSSLTIRGLSEATGVSVGTLYNYFGDKTGLTPVRRSSHDMETRLVGIMALVLGDLDDRPLCLWR